MVVFLRLAAGGDLLMAPFSVLHGDRRSSEDIAVVSTHNRIETLCICKK